MRKIGIFFLTIVLFMAAALMGYYYYRVTKLNAEIAKMQDGKDTNVLTEGEVVQINTRDEISEFSKQANSREEKVSPNCTLIIKKYYKKCGHTLNEYSFVPTSLVNLSEEEVVDYYADFELKGFSPREIVILQEIEGECNEHYVLKEKDGWIVIYLQNTNGEESFYKETNISTEYLTQTDLIKIKAGIKANGKEELNGILEDFE